MSLDSAAMLITMAFVLGIVVGILVVILTERGGD